MVFVALTSTNRDWYNSTSTVVASSCPEHTAAWSPMVPVSLRMISASIFGYEKFV